MTYGHYRYFHMSFNHSMNYIKQVIGPNLGVIHLSHLRSLYHLPVLSFPEPLVHREPCLQQHVPVVLLRMMLQTELSIIQTQFPTG